MFVRQGIHKQGYASKTDSRICSLDHSSGCTTCILPCIVLFTLVMYVLRTGRVGGMMCRRMVFDSTVSFDLYVAWLVYNLRVWNLCTTIRSGIGCRKVNVPVRQPATLDDDASRF